MAKFTIQKNNFTAGELSDELITRTDIPQYASGVRRRDGTRIFTALADTSARVIRVFDARSILVFSSNRLDIISLWSGAVMATIPTLWDVPDVYSLSFAQQREKMWIAGAGREVYWLRRSEDYATWVLEIFPLDVAPFDEITPTVELELTPSGKDVGTQITLTMESPGAWTAGDVGKYVSINGGLCKVTEFVSLTVVKALVMQALTSAVLAVPKSWTLKETIWTASLGYPQCVTYYKQRLVCGSTVGYPSHVWFSRIGDERNFEMTTNDADAFAVVAANELAGSVRHLSPLRNGVVAMGSRGEFLISSADQPLAPTTVQVGEQSAYGAHAVQTVRIGGEVVFVQRGGERVRAMSYRYDVDALVADEVSVFAAHIAPAHGGILQMAYQQEPDSVLWCALVDGKVASLTLNREQQVVAWALHDFGGIVRAISVFDDVMYLLVHRGDQMLLEVMDPQCLTDGTLVGVVTGDVVAKPDFPHLNTMAKATHNNRVYSVTAASTSSITIDAGVPNGQTVRVGLPLTCRIRLFPPEPSDAPSTGMQSLAKVDRITLVLKKTLGITLNGDDVALQTHDDMIFGNPVPFTGRATVELLGWHELHDLDITITQTQPLPFRLLSVILDMRANEK